ncbi:UNVERIFIED_CONTAM: hypothetical protein Sangu_0402400 [Sesamum angustifolium]|uniref:Uncharacterized protein n=1 Tax=Sesamum angustifolium TaxID=2727405 RepID=A0AAW2QSR3_9LAMI
MAKEVCYCEGVGVAVGGGCRWETMKEVGGGLDGEGVEQWKQYRECEFKTYSELISCLLVAEELLLNNHHIRPTGSKSLPENSAALPEVNATSSRKGSGRYHGSPWGHSYGRGSGYGGRGRGHGNDRGNHHNTWINPNIQKKNGIKAKNQHEKTTNGDICHKCGMYGHWSRTSRTAQHLVELYQASLKVKGKEIETNLLRLES